jgi:hypothetical protein
MKNLPEIRQKLYNVLRQTEAFRIEKAEAYKKGLMYTFGTIGLGILLIFLGLSQNGILAILGVFVSLSSIAVFIFTARKHPREYADRFKSSILKEMVEQMHPGVHYQPKGFIEKTEFNNSKLFSSNSNIYYGEDYFSGNFKAIKFEMSELTVQRRTQSHNNGKTSSSTSTIFKGLFIIMETPKNSYGETYIFPDTAEKLLGSFGKMIQKKLGSLFQRGSMIYLEEFPEFEKKYVVYSTEEIESRRLLNSNLIDIIMDTDLKWGVKPSFAFVHNKIYIGVPYRKNLFKISMSKSLIDNQEEILQEFMDEIALCMSVIEEIAVDSNLK